MIGTLKNETVVKCLIRHYNWEHDSHESILKHKFKKTGNKQKAVELSFPTVQTLIFSEWFAISDFFTDGSY